jgi:hypothetical protein
VTQNGLRDELVAGMVGPTDVLQPTTWHIELYERLLSRSGNGSASASPP